MHEFLPTAAQLELEIAHLHHLRDSLKALEELPETLKLLNPRLYMQYADGLTKLGRSMEDFKDSHLEEDVIPRRRRSLKKVRALSEVNPMLGHRGVRLGITYPEIYSMQIQAILEAAALCAKEGIEVHPEIMVPQVATVEELVRIHSYVTAHPQGGRADARHQRRLQVRQHARSGARLPARRPHGRRMPSSSASAPTT